MFSEVICIGYLEKDRNTLSAISIADPMDDLTVHIVFWTWRTPGRRGNMPAFLSYFSKNKVMGKNLAPIEKKSVQKFLLFYRFI